MQLVHKSHIQAQPQYAASLIIIRFSLPCVIKSFTWRLWSQFNSTKNFPFLNIKENNNKTLSHIPAAVAETHDNKIEMSILTCTPKQIKKKRKTKHEMPSIQSQQTAQITPNSQV